MTSNIISLFDLTLILESVIDETFAGKYYWVTAEISSINIRRGHCYLNLIDKDAGSAFPKAEMKGIIWQNNFERINEKFSSITGFSLKQDITILFLCVTNFSPRYGLSLNIVDIKGEFTLGEMMQDRQKTIEKLIINKLYDLNKQQIMPPVPQRIAALSAMDSKGFEDFLNVLRNNPFEYKFSVKLFPVMLQGNKAAESISKQLKVIGQQPELFDIIVLVRGGGGNVDLHCFNSYILAESIALSPLPVITGIGHTTDFTVADEVTAVHKETPTAVAQYIISQCSAFEDTVNDLAGKLSRQTIRLLDYEEMYLEKAADAIQYKPSLMFGKEKIYLSRAVGALTAKSLGVIKVALAETDTLVKATQTNLKRYFKTEKEQLQSGEQFVLSHDPMLMLKKGYSITRCSGVTIKNPKNIRTDDEIETLTAGGKIISTVKSTIPENGTNELQKCQN